MNAGRSLHGNGEVQISGRQYMDLSNAVSSVRFSVRNIFLPMMACLTLGTVLASAQDSPGRFEIGGNFTTTHSHVGDYQGYGAGVEGDINFGQHFALDNS